MTYRNHCDVSGTLRLRQNLRRNAKDLLYVLTILTCAAGKSTLLKLMCGDITPVVGDVKRHSHLSIGRYNQHSADQLDNTQTVLDFFQVRWGLGHNIRV